MIGTAFQILILCIIIEFLCCCIVYWWICKKRKLATVERRRVVRMLTKRLEMKNGNRAPENSCNGNGNGSDSGYVGDSMNVPLSVVASAPVNLPVQISNSSSSESKINMPAIPPPAVLAKVNAGGGFISANSIGNRSVSGSAGSVNTGKRKEEIPQVPEFPQSVIKQSTEEQQGLEQHAIQTQDATVVSTNDVSESLRQHTNESNNSSANSPKLTAADFSKPPIKSARDSRHSSQQSQNSAHPSQGSFYLPLTGNSVISHSPFSSTVPASNRTVPGSNFQSNTSASLATSNSASTLPSANSDPPAAKLPTVTTTENRLSTSNLSARSSAALSSTVNSLDISNNKTNIPLGMVLFDDELPIPMPPIMPNPAASIMSSRPTMTSASMMYLPQDYNTSSNFQRPPTPSIISYPQQQQQSSSEFSNMALSQAFEVKGSVVFEDEPLFPFSMPPSTTTSRFPQQTQTYTKDPFFPPSVMSQIQQLQQQQQSISELYSYQTFDQNIRLRKQQQQQQETTMMPMPEMPNVVSTPQPQTWGTVVFDDEDGTGWK
jgi:hypothetical protein